MPQNATATRHEVLIGLRRLIERSDAARQPRELVDGLVHGNAAARPLDACRP